MAHDPPGCCLVGDPGYYRKFGFKNMSELVLEGVQQEVFFALFSCLGHAFSARQCEELKADITAKLDKKIAYSKR
jgi:hypothetical protein